MNRYLRKLAAFNKLMGLITEEAQPSNRFFFMWGADWAEDNPNWISVDDEMPKGQEDVLVAVVGMDDVMKGYWNGGRWFICDDSSEWHNITHWMPLPSPPKKGGEE